MSQEPSIKDVASRANVAVGTVSNVLNRPHKVSEGTRRRVEKAIEELGFVPSEIGRNLRKGQSRLVGVIVFDIGNPFFTAAARAMETRLKEDGCFPMLCSSDGNPQEEAKLLQLLTAQQVRGLILTPAQEFGTLLPKIERLPFPVVLMDYPRDTGSFSSVSVDDIKGAEIAIEHLISQGHTTIGFINGPLEVRQARDRRRGVRKLSGHATIVEQVATHFNAAAGEAAAHFLITQHPEITAIFCANDQLAIGAMRAARGAGLSIPADMSIVGFDDVDIVAELSPALTTVRQPIAEMGRAAAEILLAKNDEPVHIKFEPTLTKRSSTAPPHR